MSKHIALAWLVLLLWGVSEAKARPSAAQIESKAIETIDRLANGAVGRNGSISANVINQVNSLISSGRTSQATRVGNLGIRAVQGNTNGALIALRAIYRVAEKLLTRAGGDPTALTAAYDAQVLALQSSRDAAVADIQAALP